MTEQLKQRVDQGQRMTLPQDQPQLSISAAPQSTAPQGPVAQPAPTVDDAEAQMRRALGLFGEPGARQRPDPDRGDSGQRTGGGFMQNAHRRRFVQDGEVPVTVVRRDAPDTNASPAGPTSSRLQRVEAALAAESAARDRAERALHETHAALQALQTKIGHNELAKNEAIAASRRDREEVVTLREQLAGLAEQTRDLEDRANGFEAEARTLRADLAEERRARKLAERLLEEATAEAARLASLDASPVHRNAAVQHPASGHDGVERIPARRGRPPLVRAEPGPEPEPVKWWLTPPKTSAKRR